MSSFDYLIDRISMASFVEEPFRHLYVENFFSERDFSEIVHASEVRLRAVANDEELIAELHARNFKEIGFPGSTTDVTTYLKWHRDPRSQRVLNQETCEGFGVTFRLQQGGARSIVHETVEFFRSFPFWGMLAEKFGLPADDVLHDIGLQKYLDGYEISPHPDIRRKALTFMLNINPAPNSEDMEFHTQYLTFKPERDYVERFWAKNPDLDRCWVPWNWCVTQKQQRKNNSIVIFSPANNTLHAVKASYDHLATQRTQFYGNLWYKESPAKTTPSWRDLARLGADAAVSQGLA